VKIKKSIKKAFLIAAWLVVCSGMLTLLIAANQKTQDHVCKKVIITINGNGEKYSIDKGDIMRLLQTATHSKLLQQPVSAFNIANLENFLKEDTWIGDANIYFDSQDVMHVLVSENEPVARIFTASGASFYIDSAARRMPLLPKVSMRLPVFTNYPDRIRPNAKDSALVAGVKSLALFINKDAFWSAQIAQIDIAEAGTFEAIPMIGNHIIKMGKADHIDQKFKRLFLFYKQVLSKTGFDKYKVLNIEFDNQVVATRNGAASAIDSVQLQRNVQALLQKNNLQQAEAASNNIIDTVRFANTILFKPAADTTAHTAKPKAIAAHHPVSGKPKTKVSPIKTNKSAAKPKGTKVPKAVMPKKR